MSDYTEKDLNKDLEHIAEFSTQIKYPTTDRILTDADTVKIYRDHIQHCNSVIMAAKRAIEYYDSDRAHLRADVQEMDGAIFDAHATEDYYREQIQAKNHAINFLSNTIESILGLTNKVLEIQDERQVKD